jgi:hypothetical protein
MVKSYWFTEDGRAFSFKRKKERELRGSQNSSGYIQLRLMGRKGSALYLLHRLVAEAFIPNPENKQQVNHKDSNRTNNHIENLEWVTPEENVQHALKSGRMKGNRGEKNGRAKLTEEQVEEIREQLGRGVRQVDIAERFGIGQAHVSRIARNVSWRKVS